MIMPAEFERQMKELKELAKSDPEGAHFKADELMCDTLESLGYAAGVNLFKNMGRWYA